MLDTVCVLSFGGVVLWQRSAHETRRRALVNQLIATVLLEDRTGAHDVVLDDCKLHWSLHNDAGLAVVAVYSKFVVVPNISAFLAQLAGAFAEQHKSAVAIAASEGGMARLLDCAAVFDARYDCLLGMFGLSDRQGDIHSSAQPRVASITAHTRPDGCARDTCNRNTDDDDNAAHSLDRGDGAKEAAAAATAAATENTASSSTATAVCEGKILVTRQGKRVLVRNERGAPALAASEPSRRNKSDDSGVKAAAFAAEGAAMPATAANGNKDNSSVSTRKRRAKLPTMSDKPSRRAVVVVASNDDHGGNNSNKNGSHDNDTSVLSEVQLCAQAERQKATLIRRLPNGAAAPVCERQWDERDASHTRLSSWLRSHIGKRELDAQTLQSIIPQLRDKLLAKNVALEVAQHVCTSVQASLAGTRLGTLDSLQRHVEAGMTAALKRILQPSREVNLLRDAAASQRRGRPYTIVFCGVNGVGKSTSLAKVAYWLTQNSMRVLLAAGDTFRHGAVEQLLVHSRCLDVPLFQMGYGADPSAVAAAAIAHAARQHIDVVMIDTAGRMQDHEPRMRALAKLIHDNTPDLVLFVGEALVGNNGVDQLRKFNRCLIDYAPAGAPCRGIDGIVLTKFDTIDDKVGAALSMVYELGQPIVFVGVGQAYQDLKVLDPDVVVSALMQ